MEDKKILQTLRTSLGLLPDSTDFDTEIKMYMTSALATLRQNGCIKSGVTVEEETLWSELKDPLKVAGNEYFDLVPSFVFSKVKIIFDPPPPSNVEYYNKHNDEILWRLRSAYEPEEVPVALEVD